MRKRGTESNGVIPSLTRRVKIGKFSSAARLKKKNDGAPSGRAFVNTSRPSQSVIPVPGKPVLCQYDTHAAPPDDQP